MRPNNITRRTLLALAGAAIAAGMATSPARASPPLRVILPVGPGSGVDVIARSAQQALSKALGGQPVVIENLPGAGGMIGTQALVQSAPDGNTIAFVSNNHAVNPSVYKKLPYDSLADITPISIIGGSPFVFVVNPKVPANNAKELQTLIRSKPGDYNYGSSGNGTIIHLAGEMFMDEAGVQARHIPYKGMGPMITDIMSGQIEMGASALAAVQGQLKAGTLRAIGVMGKDRVASLPDLPTIAEQGLPGVDVAGWFAVVGPKGLPPGQVKRLHDAVVAAFNEPEVKAGFAARDDILMLTTPEEAGKYFASEQERYGRLVRKAKVSLE
ncbi:MAG TPA: tripartite tricarboxylate transporter substrate binding protein [Burkholderiaceae bacterium]|nr:tripartite tricarboxylate transporter substrate binding protein [Burkholderiaceae bacterium]